MPDARTENFHGLLDQLDRQAGQLLTLTNDLEASIRRSSAEEQVNSGAIRATMASTARRYRMLAAAFERCTAELSRKANE